MKLCVCIRVDNNSHLVYSFTKSVCALHHTHAPHCTHARMERVCIHGAPTYVWATWSVIAQLLPPFAREVVKFTSQSNILSHLTQLYDAEVWVEKVLGVDDPTYTVGMCQQSTCGSPWYIGIQPMYNLFLYLLLLLFIPTTLTITGACGVSGHWGTTTSCTTYYVDNLHLFTLCRCPPYEATVPVHGCTHVCAIYMVAPFLQCFFLFLVLFRCFSSCTFLLILFFLPHQHCTRPPTVLPQRALSFICMALYEFTALYIAAECTAAIYTAAIHNAQFDRGFFPTSVLPIFPTFTHVKAVQRESQRFPSATFVRRCNARSCVSTSFRRAAGRFANAAPSSSTTCWPSACGGLWVGK